MSEQGKPGENKLRGEIDHPLGMRLNLHTF